MNTNMTGFRWFYLHPYALDESSLSIDRVKHNFFKVISAVIQLCQYPFYCDTLVTPVIRGHYGGIVWFLMSPRCW